MKIIVTGGMGFIGANVVQTLIREDICAAHEIIVVDNLTYGDKYKNLASVAIGDYTDKSEFLDKLKQGYWGTVDAVLHQGACSSTVENNGRYMMENNYQYTVSLFHHCQAHKIPLIYASSAAVYGLARHCKEGVEAEGDGPLNVYGYSKWLFDQFLKREKDNLKAPVVGLRYFNVYGAHEQHKGRMASVIFHLDQQWRRGEPMRLFEGYDGYAHGEQKRDFVFVDDVASINMFFLKKMLENRPIIAKSLEHTMNGYANPHYGIFNAGSGVARPFNDIPCALANMREHRNDTLRATPESLVKDGKLLYIPFPNDLKGKYQSFTEADLTYLRTAGYDKPFADLYEGVQRYWPWLENIGLMAK